MTNAIPRWILPTAGALGLTGVALGAFGAHYLKETLLARETLSVWQTAVLYHLVHSVALFSTVGWNALNRQATLVAGCWTTGIVLFSGSLYWLALGGPKLLGPITPLGGLALLTGWAGVIWSGVSPKKP